MYAACEASEKGEIYAEQFVADRSELGNIGGDTSIDINGTCRVRGKLEELESQALDSALTWFSFLYFSDARGRCDDVGKW